MTDHVIAFVIGFFGVLGIGAIVSHAFHSWLAQRERERLSATDKAALEKRLEVVDAKLLELKNSRPR